MTRFTDKEMVSVSILYSFSLPLDYLNIGGFYLLFNTFQIKIMDIKKITYDMIKHKQIKIDVV